MSDVAFYGYAAFSSLAVCMVSVGLLLISSKFSSWMAFVARCVSLPIIFASLTIFIYVQGENVVAQKAIQAEQQARHEIRIIEEGTDAYRDDIPVQCNPYAGISADDARLWTKGWIEARNNRVLKKNWQEWRQLQ